MTTTTPLTVSPPGESTPSPRVLAAIAVTIVAWASAFIVIRGVGHDFSPGSLALGRLLVGAACLTLVVVRQPWVAPTRREWLLIVLFGITWFGVYNVALNTAELTLDAGTTAMIVNVAPILIAFGAGLVLGEGLPKWLLIGAVVAFAGVLLIGIATGGATLGNISGVLWCLAAALSYAVGVLAQKPTLRRMSSVQVTWLGCVIGLVACLPFAGDLLRDVQSSTPLSILGVVYLGAVPTALAFTTWGYALSRMPAGRLGVSTYIVPPLAIGMGFLAFGEVPTLVAVLGGAICLVGVALSRRRVRAGV
ncbi:DMT family transporter [Planctomonas psychrotolerans]|uniref:DMT family transporter n=1 Tax=Planctomonas psychrotolerans TaxID=2528712 RepID=UPI00123B0A7E|nr:DMT family transporter [Planctomonas psychrotolerans]